MGKKLIATLILFLLLWISGCSGSNTSQNSSTAVQTEIPTDTEIIEGMKTSKTPAEGKKVSQQNEDILELKHWKYGSERTQPSAQQIPEQPVYPQPPQQPQLPVMDESGREDWETVSIQILSEEEIVKTMKTLIQLGYLKEPVKTELEFQAAIRDFQRDNSLLATGKLDGPTRELLSNK